MIGLNKRSLGPKTSKIKAKKDKMNSISQMSLNDRQMDSIESTPYENVESFAGEINSRAITP